MMARVDRALRIAVVGSGPSGMYAAGHLLRGLGGGASAETALPPLDAPVDVDMLERLPTPWGLVRNGVAPDHPEKKLVTQVFESIARHPRFRFFGNIELGRDVQVSELAEWYDAVIYATGVDGDSRLGIPGEDLPGCSSAREFVGWYNGHPDFSDLHFDLSGERAVVVGVGNVALDVARILVADPARLAGTDIAAHALDALRTSAVREVVILGRRGPLEASFTNPELEELGQLDDVDVIVDPLDLPSDAEAESAGAGWAARRKLETLRRYASRPLRGCRKRIVLRFRSSPVELVGTDRLEGVRLVRNELHRDADGILRARPTGEPEPLGAGLLLRSIGMFGSPIPGLPFDDRLGIVPNRDGRVTDDGQPVAGAYVVGWIKRGPKGVIGTNKKCAADTVASLMADAAGGGLPTAGTLGGDAVAEVLRARQPRLVPYGGWQKIDRHEQDAGRAAGRPRTKVTGLDEMLRLALSSNGGNGSSGPARFDVVVIGSGLGGLVSAACLAAAGRSVLVLEQHEIAGGCSQVFRRKNKWEWDCGVHYVGGCEPGSDGMIATVLRGLGVEDRVEWSRLDDDGMDTVLFPDHQFRVPTDWDRFTDSLCAAFPGDAPGLRRCLAELRRIGVAADSINDVPHSVRVVLPLAKHPLDTAAIVRGFEWPISRLFDRCGLSEQARAAILWPIHLHNVPPAKTPALLLGVLLQHFFRYGAYFPTRGGQVLAANFVEIIEAYGGTVRTRARVASIDVEAHRVQGVTLVDGERIRADVVISNADAHRTFLDLIGPEHLPRRTVERIRRFRRTHAIYATYLAADIDLSRTRPATNYILHGRYDPQTTFDLLEQGRWDPDAWLAISSPTLKTGGIKHFGEPGHSVIELFTTVPGDYEFWGGGDPMQGSGYKRSPVYQARKEEIDGVLVERTLQALPELRGHIVWQESSSPLTHERFTLSRMAYGPENAKDQIGPGRRLSVTTPIKGLYLAGASTVFLYGVAFTMRGGVGTASRILGRDLYRAFRAGEILVDRDVLPTHGPDWDPFMVCRRHSEHAASTSRLLAHSIPS